MAIALKFIDFIVPIQIIKEKYPGGWEQCLADHAHLLGRRVWHDDYLFRDGAMSPHGIEALINEWTRLGFVPTSIVDGKTVWNECCVVERMFGGPTLPCKWIEITEDGRAACLRGSDMGIVVGGAAS